MEASRLRALPSVDQLLQSGTAAELVDAYGRGLLVEAVREVLKEARAAIPRGAAPPDTTAIFSLAQQKLEAWTAPGLAPVINASGVVLHTNLGRAPLSNAAAEAVERAARGYTALEFDLQRGSRGSREGQIEDLLRRLTGAPASLVVNNNAAAVLLALTALARRRRVIISRSQLIEIGGGFRVPDVMKQSGAILVEIGATNRVHLADYEAALAEPAALVMRAHSSNFRIIGFASEPELGDLAEAAHARGLPLFDDIGSGALLDTRRYGLGHEPMVQESLRAGADLVCFSGDKLLGGPQAGILVGSEALTGRLRKHPLFRALRADKLCLAALAATLVHYLKGEAEREVPVWRMISLAPDVLRARAEGWRQALGRGEVIRGRSTVGGGSLPEETLPAWLLALDDPRPLRLLERLRAGKPPVIGRVEDGRVLLDPRTVAPEEEEALLRVAAEAASAPAQRGGRETHEI